MRRTIDPIARLLAAKLEFRRRRNHHGAVDVRATLRASMSTGGIPIDLRRRKPRPGKPELVVICDVSGSVAGFSQFTLQLVYALRQQFSHVRVFAFVDTVDEVTEFFDRGNSDEQFGERMTRMLSEASISTRDGHSDYGHMLKGFEDRYGDSLTHRSALLILGDARNNFRPTHADALVKMRDRVPQRLLAQSGTRVVVGFGRFGREQVRRGGRHVRVSQRRPTVEGHRRPAAGVTPFADRRVKSVGMSQGARTPAASA